MHFSFYLYQKRSSIQIKKKNPKTRQKENKITKMQNKTKSRMHKLWHTRRAKWQKYTKDPASYFSNFRYFNDENLMCDCDVMWFVYVRHDKPFVTQGGKCSKNNKTLSELVPQDFDCIGMYNKASLQRIFILVNLILNKYELDI